MHDMKCDSTQIRPRVSLGKLMRTVFAEMPDAERASRILRPHSVRRLLVKAV